MKKEVFLFATIGVLMMGFNASAGQGTGDVGSNSIFNSLFSSTDTMKVYACESKAGLIRFYENSDENISFVSMPDGNMIHLETIGSGSYAADGQNVSSLRYEGWGTYDNEDYTFRMLTARDETRGQIIYQKMHSSESIQIFCQRMEDDVEVGDEILEGKVQWNAGPDWGTP